MTQFVPCEALETRPRTSPGALSLLASVPSRPHSIESAGDEENELGEE